MVKPRSLLLVGIAMIFSGWIGYTIGQQGVRISFYNWKPAVVANKQVNVAATSGQEVDFAQFWTIWNELNDKYVDKSKLDAKKMVDGAISGMVAALGDPYTVFLPVTQNEAAKESLGGAFEGVGMELGFDKNNRLVVMAPLDGSPAKKAGVRSGDYVLKIVDEKAGVSKLTDGLDVQSAVKLIRGKGGTAVKLTFARDGVDKPFEVTLVRDTIVIKSVNLEFLDKNSGAVTGGKEVAWLKLLQFGDRTQNEWNDAVTRIVNECGTDDKKCQGVVLDLRGNPGGYLEGAVYVAGEFLPAGRLVVTQQSGDGAKLDNKVERNGRLLGMPVTVIVNKGSASAAEILSGALQDYHRVKVVGEQSFGKGSVQEPEDFADGSGIHITIAKWLRPLGDWIDKKGITPDMVVKWEDPTSELPKDDPQLKKAIEVL